jgi:hypothetical protein
VVRPIRVTPLDLKNAIQAIKNKTEDQSVKKPRKQTTRDRPGVSRPGLQTVVTVQSITTSQAQINDSREEEQIQIRNNPNDSF